MYIYVALVMMVIMLANVGDDGAHCDNVGGFSVFGQSMVFWRRTDDGENFDDVQLEG